MSDILLKQGQYSLAEGDAPAKVHFEGATDIIMPFKGSIIRPRNPADEAPDYSSLSLNSWLQFSYLYPESVLSIPEEIRGELGPREVEGPQDPNDIAFRNLRDFNGRPVISGTKTVLLIEDGFTFWENNDTDNLFGDSSNPGFALRYTEAVMGLSSPAVILLDFSMPFGNLEGSPLPISRDRGFPLRESNWYDTLFIPRSNLSGRIRAFDMSGREMEALSALRALGVDKPGIGTTNPPAPQDTDFLIQFVDLHGTPLERNDPAFQVLEFTPALDLENDYIESQKCVRLNLAQAPEAGHFRIRYNGPAQIPVDHIYYGGAYPGFAHTLVRLSHHEDHEELPDIFIDEAASVKLFQFFEGMRPEDAKTTWPRFARICLFPATREFQQDAGGDLESVNRPHFPRNQPVFSHNKLQGFTDQNQVEVFNTGKDFLRDFYDELDLLREGDEMYQTNWQAHGHALAMGRSIARDVAPFNGIETELRKELLLLFSPERTVLLECLPYTQAYNDFYFSADGNDNLGTGSPSQPFASIAKLNALVADGSIGANDRIHFRRGDGFEDVLLDEDQPAVPLLDVMVWGNPELALPSFPLQEAEESAFLTDLTDSREYVLVSKSFAQKDDLKETFYCTVTEEEPANEEELPVTTIVRHGQFNGLKIHGAPTPGRHRFRAQWKNSSGSLYNNITDFQEVESEVVILPRFPNLDLALGITGEDPAKATLEAPANVRSRAEEELGLLEGHDVSLALLVLNLDGGHHHFFPLEDGQGNALRPLTDADGTFKRSMHGEDRLAIALADMNALDAEHIQDTLLTSFQSLAYSDAQHKAAEQPFHDTEIGGMLRNVIAKGVHLRYVLWEQHLAKINGGPELEKGYSNNEAIKNLVNKTVGQHRGYAMLQRANRPFAAAHHKITVLVKNVVDGAGDEGDEPLFGRDGTQLIAYLGGMDLAHYRWDTEEHFSDDPDTTGSTSVPWTDTHMKVTGSAALDVFHSISHLLKTQRAFIADEAPDDMNCGPVETNDGDIRDDLDAFQDKYSFPYFNKVVDDDFLIFPHVPGPLVQINRTLPRNSCFALDVAEDGSEVHVPAGGEFGCLASYRQAIRNARKFIYLQDQYFYSQELGLEIYNNLSRTDGADFAVIVLPQELGDSAILDPVSYRQREKVFNTVCYGAIEQPGQVSTTCGSILHHTEANTPKSVRDKVVFLSQVNRNGAYIYMHAKHLIVDDIWMSIGSCNFGNRSMTYDQEMSAAIVGRNLMRGGTDTVRTQRIELFRILAGIKPEFGAIMADPYAGFRFFKNLENYPHQVNFNVMPYQIMAKKLDFAAIPLNEGSAFLSLGSTTQSLNFINCSVLDPDSRLDADIDLEYIAFILQFGKSAPGISLRLNPVYSLASRDLIKGHFDNGQGVYCVINATYSKLDTEGVEITTEPIEQHRLDLELIADNQIDLDNPPDPDNPPEPVNQRIRFASVEADQVFILTSPLQRMSIRFEYFLTETDTLICEGTLEEPYADPERAEWDEWLGLEDGERWDSWSDFEGRLAEFERSVEIDVV